MPGSAADNPLLRGNHSIVVGDDAGTSSSILKAQRASESFCRKRGNQMVMVLREETLYQGRVDETINEAAKAASRVAMIYGGVEGAQAGRALGLGSETDYKTTIECSCVAR